MANLIERRLHLLATGANLIGGLLGVAMLLIGTFTTAQLFFMQDSFSAPQLGLILLGFILALFSVREDLAHWTISFAKSRGSQNKVFFLPIFGSLLIVLYKKFVLVTPQAFQSYLRTISEGSLIEWGSFFLLIAAAVLCYLTARPWSLSIVKLILLTFSSGLLLIGMEEMSWGQMIFNWEIPGEIAKYNIQDESTIHNIWFIHHHSWMIASFVISIAFILSVAGFWVRRKQPIRANSVANVVLPIWPTASYFLTSALIYWCVVALKSGVVIPYLHTMEQEIGELFFYSGIFIHSVYLYLLPASGCHESAAIGIKSADLDGL